MKETSRPRFRKLGLPEIIAVLMLLLVVAPCAYAIGFGWPVWVALGATVLLWLGMHEYIHAGQR